MGCVPAELRGREGSRGGGKGRVAILFLLSPEKVNVQWVGEVLALRVGWASRLGGGRGVRKELGAILFLLSLEKVNVQWIGGGVLTGLWGREGAGRRKRTRGYFIFTFSGESKCAAGWRGCVGENLSAAWRW
ncbi:MAG: hypothetical protein GX589_06325 [Deltaproteobacteria bacterium]|nr:hypothetical protein [Deltaproteobacteria bacterium]